MSFQDTPDETHPSFAVAIVNRTTSSQGQPMFQSDLLHREFISLRIATAVRKRDLNHDWVHPREELIEIQMSLAQWGALVSSMGIGSGVPVTLVYREAAGRIPEPPHEPRMQANLDEVDGAVEKMMAETVTALGELTAAIEGKKGARAVREALVTLTARVRHARSNTKFAVKSLNAAAEKVVANARADIEASIIAAAAATGGRVSLEAPELPTVGVLEAPEEPTS
jgi:hypothetical protein